MSRYKLHIFQQVYSTHSQAASVLPLLYKPSWTRAQSGATTTAAGSLRQFVLAGLGPLSPLALELDSDQEASVDVVEIGAWLLSPVPPRLRRIVQLLLCGDAVLHCLFGELGLTAARGCAQAPVLHIRVGGVARHLCERLEVSSTVEEFPKRKRLVCDGVPFALQSCGVSVVLHDGGHLGGLVLRRGS
jgi:hypothetical protein